MGHGIDEFGRPVRRRQAGTGRLFSGSVVLAFARGDRLGRPALIILIAQPGAFPDRLDCAPQCGGVHGREGGRNKVHGTQSTRNGLGARLRGPVKFNGAGWALVHQCRVGDR